jgi:hypothetical protein
MAEREPQTFENHARYVPAYHFVAFPILVLNLVWSIYKIWRSTAHWTGRFTLVDAALSLLVAVALPLMFFYARLFALTVQDRLIRLEMHLRLARLLPSDLQPRIKDFTVDQLIALRFASDGEIPDLCRKVLTEKLTDRKTIKQMIKTWVPDHLRV